MESQGLEGRELIGKIIREARGSRSLRNFGKLTKISHTTIRRIETAEDVPSNETLMALAEFTPYTFEELQAILQGREPTDLREVVTAHDALKIVKQLPPDEIEKLTHMLVTLLRHTEDL